MPRADSRLRRGGRRHPARQRAPASSTPGARHAGRDALRRRRQPLVRLGRAAREHDGVAVFNPEGKLIGPHPDCRSAAPTSASAGPSAIASSWRRQPVALLALRQHPGRARRLIPPAANPGSPRPPPPRPPRTGAGSGWRACPAHVDERARDIGRLLRGQEADEIGHVPGDPPAPERQRVEEPPLVVGGRLVKVVHLGGDHARRHSSSR